MEGETRQEHPEIVQARKAAAAAWRVLRAAWRIWPWIALALALISAAAWWWLSSHAVLTRALPGAQPWRHETGYMYMASVPELHDEADKNDAPLRSKWVLLENGQPIGKPHSAHQTIIEGGGGLYSHWQDFAYISTPDNSDPSTNGRIYALQKSDPAARVQGQALGIAAIVLALLGFAPLSPRALGLFGRGRFWSAAPPVLSVIVIPLMLWAVVGYEHRFTLDLSKAVNSGGFMYTVPLPGLAGSADTRTEARRSSLRLFENGLELGPAHCEQADLVSGGKGCFRHLETVIALTASDNSDVRTNGRVYTALETVRPPIWLSSIVIVLWLGLFLAAFERRGGLREPKPATAREALRDTGMPLFVVGGLAFAFVALVGVGLSDTETTGQTLAAVRSSVEWIVAALLAAAGAAVLTLTYRGGWFAGFVRPIGGALVVAMTLYGILDRSYGLYHLSPLILGLFIAALAAGLVVRFGRPALYEQISTRAAQLATADPRAQLRLAIGVCCVLTLIEVAPEVLLYWDQSGWQDSRTYDYAAHAIATGALPAGDGTYPPVYQYGLAALYWVFGHYFFVQQLANAALALVTTACLCGAAWLFFRNIFVVWLMGLIAAHWEMFHHATWYTQIEGWYVPAIALSLLALAWYLSRRTLSAMLMLGAAAALVFATRQQGAFYAAALGLSALIAVGLTFRGRIAHLAAFGLVFASLGLAPWSLRNYAVDGRLSPASDQASEYIAVYNDMRIPLYGIRYWQGADDVWTDWYSRYPEKNARRKAMAEYFAHEMLQTDFFIKAAPWRAASFYGLLPMSVIYGTGTIEQVLANPWEQIQLTFPFWAPLLLSLLGLLCSIGSLRAWFLFVLAPANLIAGLLVSTAEPRLAYPVMEIHMLLALALLAPFAPASPLPQGAATGALSWLKPSRLGWAAGFVVAAVVTHLILGAPGRYREIKTATYLLGSDVSIDRSLPLIAYDKIRLTVDGQPQSILTPGRRYRGVFTLTNSQFPPKYAEGLAGVDPNLFRHGSVQYFLTGDTNAPIAVRFDAVQTARPLREGMRIEGEFVVDATSTVVAGTQTNWLRLDKAVVTDIER